MISEYKTNTLDMGNFIITEYVAIFDIMDYLPECGYIKVKSKNEYLNELFELDELCFNSKFEVIDLKKDKLSTFDRSVYRSISIVKKVGKISFRLRFDSVLVESYKLSFAVKLENAEQILKFIIDNSDLYYPSRRIVDDEMILSAMITGQNNNTIELEFDLYIFKYNINIRAVISTLMTNLDIDSIISKIGNMQLSTIMINEPKNEIYKVVDGLVNIKKDKHTKYSWFKIEYTIVLKSESLIYKLHTVEQSLNAIRDYLITSKPSEYFKPIVQPIKSAK